MINYHSLGFNHLPYLVLYNRTSSNGIVLPVKVQVYFETHHSMDQEKGNEYFKYRQHALFTSPKNCLLQLFTLGTSKPLASG